MITEKIFVKTDGTGIEEALSQVDQFIMESEIKGKTAIHIRLFAEEALGMVRAMTGEFKALFWIESDTRECNLRLKLNTEMNAEKRRQLLSASSTGKNAAVKGIMGKIREMIEIGFEGYRESDKLRMEYGIGSMGSWEMGLSGKGSTAAAAAIWSLNDYKEAVEDARAAGKIYTEEWDELEKSVIANIADDVTVGISQDSVEMRITKKF